MDDYDATLDIRDYYRAQIKALTTQIESTNRRNPVLHRLHADRKLMREKLGSISQHTAPVGALAAYGVW